MHQIRREKKHETQEIEAHREKGDRDRGIEGMERDLRRKWRSREDRCKRAATVSDEARWLRRRRRRRTPGETPTQFE